MSRINRFICKIAGTIAPIVNAAFIPLLLAVMFLASGCPFLPVDDILEDPEYAVGFGVGFLCDDWYWAGFDDSYYTVDFGPIYYQGSEIPEYTEPAYDAGYWDGIWYAYNDGYFVEYDYAFTIGFSEGYDAACAIDYLSFLGGDEHTEYLDGGWSDGYDDGFSEGRVFGANDYETELPPDWLDALLDYRNGTDLYFAEVDVGTGAWGPVILYEYGTDPAMLVMKASPRARNLGRGRSIRAGSDAGLKAEPFEPPELSYRPFDGDPPEQYRLAPTTSPRSSRTLSLTTTRIERVNAYLAAAQPGTKTVRARRIVAE